MYIEYFINSFDEKDIDVKNNIDNLIKNTHIKNIISINYQSKLIKKLFSQLCVGCFIDYPVPNIEPSQRQNIITDAIKNNIDYIAITVPSYFMVNRKYDKIRDDIKKNLELCKDIELRYILEYRKFDHQILCKICEILVSLGIQTIYPATGYFLDNLEDNIIACSYLHKKTGINTITNGNCWTEEQVNHIIQSNLYGFSGNSLSTLKLFK